MCGIAGIWDPTRDASTLRSLLSHMTDVMVHRGPNDEGFYTEDGIGLGMRRLSVIDVDGGHQPISNEDGQIQVILNGEIYNYLELRKGLIQRGHKFQSQSDTEVIAHLYEEKGIDALEVLRGMFGLAIWDRNKKRLVLARDRLGKKPLFYAHQGNKLLFGSEIKTLLIADPTLHEIHAESQVAYFQYGFVPEPNTMFRKIKKLPAGHTLVLENEQVHIASYWHLDFSQDNSPDKNWRAELDALLEESVRIRLRSDVALGVFLSGGLDSSTMVAYAHKAGLHPLKTFTIGFDRDEWDETDDAQLVADHFQTEHHVLRLTEQDLCQNLPQTMLELVHHFDEPFGDPSALPTYHVSKMAREHVTVILSGDGGDELFAGYNTNRGIRFAEYYQKLPDLIGKHLIPACVSTGSRMVSGRLRYRALRALKVLRDSTLPFEKMYFSKMALCSDDVIDALLYQADIAEKVSYAPDISNVMNSQLPALSKASYADFKFRLLEDMLVKVDRMSMAHSLEVRSPFLDHRLVEFAAKMPPRLKLKGWQTKAILRDTVRPLLPKRNLVKKKQGFAVPLREWLKGDLREMVWDYLGPSSGNLPPELFHLPFVEKVIVQHYKGQADHSALIWLLLNYAGWYGLYFSQRQKN